MRRITFVCVCVYLCICVFVCVWVCVFVWRAFDSTDRFIAG